MSATDLTALNWDQPAQGQIDPFLWPLTVDAQHIDHYGHVNNSVYLQWLQDCAWAHLQTLGLQLSDYQRLDRALVVYRHELDYLAPAYQGEQLVMATWLEQRDKLSVYRRFQLQRRHDGKTLFRAYSRYVCTRLSDGKVCRLPELFLTAYAKAGL